MEYKTEVGFIRRGEEADRFLINESRADRWLGDISTCIRHLHELYVFVKDGKAVGFVIPRQDPDGYWRTGAVYITPSERTFGSVKKLTGGFFTHKKAYQFGMDFNHKIAA